MKFKDWLDEREGFSGPRMYRLMDDINSPDPAYNDMMLKWLEAAYKVGYEHRNIQLDRSYRLMDDGK